METFDRNDPYMNHVLDLEEWNEETPFVWGTPVVIRGICDSATGAYQQDLVVVVHPCTYPSHDLEQIASTTIAVYQRDGTKVALWIIDGDGSGSHVDHSYWTTPAESRAFVERTAVFRGVEAAVGDVVWDDRTNRVWTCTRVIEE